MPARRSARGGTYEALRPRRELRSIFGLDVRFVDLEMSLHLERAAVRPEDRERIAELVALRDERKK